MPAGGSSYSRGFLLFLLGLLVATNLAIILDVPVLRQVLGFTFVTFVPGLLILQVLRVGKADITTRIVLAAGLGFALAMFLGVALSGLLAGFGYMRPLSTVPVLIGYDAVIVGLALGAHFRGRNRAVAELLSGLHLSRDEKALLVVPSLAPLLSVLGTRVINATGNGGMLAATVVLIAAYVVFLCAYHRRVPPRVYPATVFLMGISLLLMFSLRSNHIIGTDTHSEFFIFRTTLANGRWGQLGFPTLDSVLAISVFPSIFQNVMGMAPEMLFKLLYSLAVSFAPLTVFVLARRQLGAFHAFIAAVFFISQDVFLWTPSFARINLAILFFALAVMVHFNSAIPATAKRLLFLLFVAATVTAHYGTTYIFFFVLVSTWAGMEVLQRLPRLRKLFPSPGSVLSSGSITAAAIGLFALIIFLWYGQMTGPTFSSGVRFVYASLTQVALGRRETVVEDAFVPSLAANAVPRTLEFAASWAMIIFIAIGVSLTVVRFLGSPHGIKRDETTHPRSATSPPETGIEYVVMGGVACALLAAVVILPYVSVYYGASRTFFQMMVLLSTFCIIGGLAVARLVRVERAHWVLLAVLLPYFLSTTGVVGVLFGYQRTVVFSTQDPLPEVNSSAAAWLGASSPGAEIVYAPGFGREVLASQSGIPYGRIDPDLGRYLSAKTRTPGNVYVRYEELRDSSFTKLYGQLLSDISRTYDNGGAQVYRGASID